MAPLSSILNSRVARRAGSYRPQGAEAHRALESRGTTSKDAGLVGGKTKPCPGECSMVQEVSRTMPRSPDHSEVVSIDRR